MKYKDKNGNITENDDYEHPINTEKFINNEILHIPEIKNIQFNSDLVELPSYRGLRFTGKGIKFSGDDHQTLHEMTDENKPKLYEFFYSGKPIKRYLDLTLSRKKGGNSFTAFPVEKDGERVPDIEYNHNYRNTTPKP